MSGRFRGLLLDVTPLRLDHDYRWLWGGQVVSGMGNQITRLALPFQVYALTGSTLAIAALTFVQLIPLLAFALVAGSLVDAVDRRKLLLLTQTGLALCSVALLLLAIGGEPPLWTLFLVAFLSAALSSVDQPARGSSIPRLVPPERLPAALALNQLNFQAASIVGPAIAGILIATVGLVGAYAVDVMTFVASFIGLLAIAPLPPMGQVRPPGLGAIREGLGYVRRHRAIMGTFVIDLNAMILAMPTSLFPAIALDVFGVGPAGLGFLASAPALGAFLGALFSGFLSTVVRVGRGVVVAVIAWGIAMALFGLATVGQEFQVAPMPVLFATACLMLAVAGAADMFSAVLRNTIVQLGTPDALRGRITSIHTLVVAGGPRLGDMQSAIVAAFIGPGQAVLLGGVLCTLGVGVVVRWLPELPDHVIRLRGGGHP